MSDARKSPPGRTASSPGTPAASGPAAPEAPAKTATNPGMKAVTSPGTRAVTNPGMKVISASRAEPPPPEPDNKKIQEKLKEGATETALNAVGILRDTYDDFKRSDRFFKYKALIIASWVGISCVTLIASCPRSELDAKNRLGARLAPRPTDPNRPAVTIFNDSDKPWSDVTIVVNDKYRAAMPQVEPHDAVTVTPRQLLGPGGKVAPPDLRATDVELRTADGKARLMKEGLEQ